MEAEKFSLFKKKMQEENIPEIVINNFREYYIQLAEKGVSSGIISRDEIDPVDNLPDSEEFGDELQEEGEKALSKTLMIKLNGGLGTGMGLYKAKSLLKVKNGMSFLDITIKQAARDRIPLILMNSFVTRKDSLNIIKDAGELDQELPYDFVQNKIPKIMKDDLRPADSEKDELNWCPPGHGDIYMALQTSQILDKMIEAGYKYAFVSNSDNLGAVMDRRILGYFAENDIPFMMETADRTEHDKKGGHLAYKKGEKGLILREIAQCPKEELEEFQDVNRYMYFNTNNLWINLPKLKKKLEEKGRRLDLTLICNEKNLNPRDGSTPKVYQLETAMGSAISVFPDARAIRVPRTRFLPVKRTNDLLKIRSDDYIMTDNYEIVKNPYRQVGETVVSLDPEHYKLVDEMERRFEDIPSLMSCERLTVIGDVRFGKDIKIKGTVKIENTKETPFYIEDGTTIDKDITS